ncbi:MAG: MupA/Atu3671 family FMN-dependent luciferase-like monooxygenase, partial [Planctomycetota bacterium]
RRNAELAKAEPFFIRRLESFEATEAPLATLRAHGSNERRVAALENLPANFAGDEALAAAFCAWLARVTNSKRPSFSVGLVTGAPEEGMAELGSLEAVRVPSQVAVDAGSDRIGDVQLRLAEELKDLRRRGAFLRDLVARRPGLRGRSEIGSGQFAPVAIDFRRNDEAPSGVDATLILALFQGSSAPRIEADAHAYSEDDLARLAAGFETFLGSVASRPESLIADHELLSAEERTRVLTGWNSTEATYRDDITIHGLFAEQVERTPDRIAAISGDERLTYRELDQRANRVAHRLVALGVTPGAMVGVCLERSCDLLVAVLAAMKASGAYLPFDPEFPSERIAFMLEDAAAPVVISTTELAGTLRTGSAEVLTMDGDAASIAGSSDSAPEDAATASDLAYVIYTSGSTGKPKGVMVEHRNASNFFTGMDERIGVEVGQPESPGNWLAVTSLSFDISVLELLWTATRGFTTVIYAGVKRAAKALPGVAGAHPGEIGFSLSFFASNAGENAAEQYRFLLEAARFADEHDFEAIWTPERHFHAFGGLYPNPSVTSAALAAVTKRLALRCGSVVVALHHPIRIAEEWSLVDNLSGGRVGISIASGWHPNDFVLAPDNYERRKEIMIENTQTVRSLWRGEAVEFESPKGDLVPTKLMPKPVQKELPIWITAAGNPETFRQAGEIGASVLTHLLGQSPEELAKKLEIYRQARRDAGITS